MSARRMWGALATLTLAAQGVAAQTGGLGPVDRTPLWLESWSPLLAAGDRPQRIPGVGVVPVSLLWPAPRVGLFWTAGNPAALREELSDTRSDLAVARARESGELKRPLDPGVASVTQASGTGWTPVDRRLGLIGRMVVDQERYDPGTYADMVEPYPTSPFVTADSSNSGTRRTRARLEGAFALQLGRWGLGGALGYESRLHETTESGLIRRDRQALPGGTIGLTRRIGSVRVGPYARWRQRAETVELIERRSEALMIQLEGIRNVTPFEILVYYYRRVEETSPSAGWAMGGPLGRGAWAVYAERNWLRQRLTRQQQNEPAEDSWNADAWNGGGAFQLALGQRTLFTLDTRYTTLRGDGDLATDTLGVIFRGREQSLVTSAELRVLPDTVGWAFVVGAQVRWDHRVRDALTVPIAAEVTGLVEGFNVEVGRALSPSWFVTASLATAFYSANSSFPAPSSLGATYDQYILPEFDLIARRMQPWMGAVAIRWSASPRTAVWLKGIAETVSPTRPAPTAYGPDGSRGAVNVSLGVTLRR